MRPLYINTVDPGLPDYTSEDDRLYSFFMEPALFPLLIAVVALIITAADRFKYSKAIGGFVLIVFVIDFALGGLRAFLQ